jgi:hypothetical protein
VAARPSYKRKNVYKIVVSFENQKAFETLKGKEIKEDGVIYNLQESLHKY